MLVVKPRFRPVCAWTRIRCGGDWGHCGGSYRRSQRKPSCLDPSHSRSSILHFADASASINPPSGRRGHRAFESSECVTKWAPSVAVESSLSPLRVGMPIAFAEILCTIQCLSIARSLSCVCAEPRVLSPAALAPHLSSCLLEPLAFSPAARAVGQLFDIAVCVPFGRYFRLLISGGGKFLVWTSVQTSALVLSPAGPRLAAPLRPLLPVPHERHIA